ncbi:MAG: group 1 truncated hemoglobin [Acidobacteria bacterium]|nr:group 1 truncated hemoglobin [Acidobacteriota bacterium]
MKRFLPLLLCCLIVTPELLLAAEQAPAPPKKPSLYERLGGSYPIAVVVDEFIDLLLLNDVLNANPAINEARARVPKAGLKFQVASLVCQATGGPCTYGGRDMKSAHAKLNISEAEWDAMVRDLVRVLNNHHVPKPEQDELLSILGSTKGDIVMRK